MAAPHVAGVFALMKSINPDLSPDDIDALLTGGALTEDLGAPGRDDRFGQGLINAQFAVLAALDSIGSAPADNPRLVASLGTLNFGTGTTRLSLALRNGGQGELALESIDATQPWLSVRPLDVSAAGLGEYEVAVDREGLAPGVYSADIVARSTVNTLSIRVFMSVGSGSAVSDVGVLYALLIDPVTDEVIAQSASAGAGGRYPFRFEGIEAGTYEILAGSDSDNDLFICDAGEACGAWLTIDRPVRIDLQGDLEGLDFPVEYQVALPTLSAGNAQPAGAAARRPDGSPGQGAGLRRPAAADEP